MEDIMIKIDSEKVFHKFSKDLQPIANIDLPNTIVIETRDCFSSDIKSEDDTLDAVDVNTVNPVTGPIYFNQAEVGDVLEIKIKNISVKSPGFTMCVPNEGLLGHIIKKPVTKFYEFDDDYVYINENVKVKLEPMVGIMGVAPKEGEVATLSPGDHGGNMDTTLLKEGATLYLPVNVKGALFGVGDLHAAMGDGESWYMGLEVAGAVELDIKIRKDLKIDIPFVMVDGKFASLASEVGSDDALKKAMLKLLSFMVDHGNVDFETAGFLSSLAGNLEISQVVDPLKTVRMSIPTYVLDQIGVEL